MDETIRRFRGTLGVLALYVLIAVAMMGPLAPDAMPHTGACDLCNHVSGIIEARNALAEGQFPVRVPPHQNNGTRYPLFQFYGNLPYTLGGVAYWLTDLDPYRVWKGEVIAFMAIGAFFTFRLSRRWTRQTLPSMAAGAAFLTAPYLLTDIHGRTAFCEIAAFCLLPVVFYCSWSAFVRPRLAAVLAGGLAWAALVLSHNITFVYAALFLGLFFLSFAAPRRRLAVRWLHVGGGLAVGVLLTLWFLVPQQMLLPVLSGGLLSPVQNMAWLVPPGVLLSPAVTLGTHLPTIFIAQPDHFGLQVGWPLLIAVGLAAAYLFRRDGPRAGRPMMRRCFALFVLALAMVGSPFDFWQYLPAVLQYVQFAYRLLMFVVLFGSLQSAYALAAALPGRMQPLHLGAVLLALGMAASPYLRPHRDDPNTSIDREIAQPDIGRGGANTVYHLSGRALAASSLTHPHINWAGPEMGGIIVNEAGQRDGRIVALLPPPFAGDAVRVAGHVAAEAQLPLRLNVLADEQTIWSREMPAGPFDVTVPLPVSGDGRPVAVVVHGDSIRKPLPRPATKPQRLPSYALHTLALLPGKAHPASPLRWLPVAATVERTEFGRNTIARLDCAEPMLAQLPVLFYPGMVDVRVNGILVEPTHAGRYIAVQLPSGPAVIEMRFVGVRWANRASQATVLAVVVAGLALVLRRLLPARRRSVAALENLLARRAA